MQLITLDASPLSKLKWEPAIPETGELLFHLDTGIFDRLPSPLGSEGQLKNLGLAIEYFYDQFYPLYKERIAGVCLYKGKLPFHFPWDSEQEENFKNFGGSKETFCREACLEYLGLLANWLPEPLEPFLLLDVSEIKDPVQLVELLSSERYTRFRRALKGSVVPTRDYVWEETITSREENANVALFIPGGVESYEFLRPGFALPNYRLVHEETLITDWDGLDFIAASSRSLSREGRRKLLGFCAAGGTVIALDDPLNVPYEVPLNEWDPAKILDI